ncbi:hypothetical protein R2K27_32015, partial [Pseudomonas aeruginosa]|uniref:hypothetical protein n=1 Tax=Pseudomonas aeruginosa TaxID=287 RepID=UPI00396F3E30
RTLSETPEGNLKWLAATSTAGTSDRLAAAKATFSTESTRKGLQQILYLHTVFELFPWPPFHP